MTPSKVIRYLGLHSHLYDLVRDFFENDQKAALWFITVNPLLGSQAPLTMVMLGRGDKLEKFIRTQLEENRAPVR